MATSWPTTISADLTVELSDNLSVLATGGGFAVRQLYTNADEHLFQASRPIVLNGIARICRAGRSGGPRVERHAAVDSRRGTPR